MKKMVKYLDLMPQIGSLITGRYIQETARTERYGTYGILLNTREKWGSLMSKQLSNF